MLDGNLIYTFFNYNSLQVECAHLISSLLI